MVSALDDFSLLVDLKDPSDLQSRSAYQSCIDVSDLKLEEVLAPYHFNEPYPCGLASCRQPHHHGFLVVTDDGVETNVGKDCGRRIFGEEFTIKANLQQKRADLKYQQEILQSARDNKNSLLSRVDEFSKRKNGAKWAENELRELKRSISHITATKLHRMATRGETAVEKEREATKDERERHSIVNANTKPLRYVSEKIGDLQGLEFLNSSPQQLLVDMKDRIYELDSVNIKNLNDKQRREWVDWVNDIERIFDAIAKKLIEATHFFSPNNILLVRELDFIETGSVRVR